MVFGFYAHFLSDALDTEDRVEIQKAIDEIPRSTYPNEDGSMKTDQVGVKTYQKVAEIAIEKVLKFLANTPGEEWYRSLCALNLLLACVQTTAVIKRVTQAKSVLRKVVSILEYAIYMSGKNAPTPRSYSCPEEFYNPQRTIRNNGVACWYVLARCVLGSKPNHALFQSLFAKFDFDCLINLEKLVWYEDYDESRWNCQIWPFVATLLHVHGCKFKFSKKMASIQKKMVRNSPWGVKAISTVVSERIQDGGAGSEYIIHCASQDCAKTAVSDGVFKLCSRCRIAAYCSIKCQQDDWRTFHKNDCLDFKNCIAGDAPVVSWCTKSKKCTIHS